MTEPPTTTTPSHVPSPDASHASSNGGGPPAAKPKLKKLRLALILTGLSALALVSTVFGMMMAVASDLPQLENRAEYRRAENSTLLGEPTGKGRKPEDLAKLTGNQNRILVKDADISTNMENAVIAIEDRRFYEHEGVDYKGIARALSQDVLRRSAVQGGSTITQQFVKNALAAQSKRTVFQKLREAALAYHLERKWSKQKVLTQYMNSVYFGNGAYGVEAAARTYFGGTSATPTTPTGLPADPATGGAQGPALRIRAARDLTPSQAALLAGIIASPSLYDPVENPRTAKRRRDHVLGNMRDQKMITQSQYLDSIDDALPSESEVTPPRPESRQPYFTTWLTQQLVDRYKAPAVFSGGLKVQTTLDPELQAAAEEAINGRLNGVGPSASLVAIENKTGKIRAMVGGTDFQNRPFNLATNGHRQPGSSFKPFTLIEALDSGVDPNSTFTSQKKQFPVPGLARRREVRGQQLRGLLLGRGLAVVGHRHVGQLGVRRAGAEGGHEEDRRAGAADGRAHQGLGQPGDDAGWPEGGPDAAGACLRVHHDRQPRRARVRLAGLLADGAGGHGSRERRGPRRQERAQDRAGVPRQGGRGGRGHAGGRGPGRHRQGGPDRRVRRRQDRHHGELRRRVVRGLQPPDDRGGVGGLSGRA